MSRNLCQHQWCCIASSCNSRMGDVGRIAFEQTLTSYIGVDLGHEAQFVCVACQPPPYVADQSEASLAIILSKKHKRRSLRVILTLLTDQIYLETLHYVGFWSALKCHLRVNPPPYLTQYSACFHLFFPFRSRVVGLHIGRRLFSEASMWLSLFESYTWSHRLSSYRDCDDRDYFQSSYFDHAAHG